MLLVDQVVAGAEGHQVGVVGRRWDGDGPRAADVGVAQLVGEELELVGGETVVVPQDVVVGRPTRTLVVVGRGGESSDNVPQRKLLRGGRTSNNLLKLGEAGRPRAWTDYKGKVTGFTSPAAAASDKAA